MAPKTEKDTKATEPAAPATTAEAPPIAPAAEQPPAQEAAKAAPAPIRTPAKLVPETNRHSSKEATALLMRACRVFGVNPDADVRPIELLNWRYYPPIEQDDVPASVGLVTAGGQKLRWFADDTMDADTDERLARVFGAYRMDPSTKLPIRNELPEDLTLPRVAVTGISAAQEHLYKDGYLKSGGKAEADKRAAAKGRGRT